MAIVPERVEDADFDGVFRVEERGKRGGGKGARGEEGTEVHIHDKNVGKQSMSWGEKADARSAQIDQRRGSLRSIRPDRISPENRI